MFHSNYFILPDGSILIHTALWSLNNSDMRALLTYWYSLFVELQCDVALIKAGIQVKLLQK